MTQGKLRENTGNFIWTRMWPPCLCMKYYIIYLEKTNFDCTIVQIIQIVHGLVGGEAEAEGHPVDQ